MKLYGLQRDTYFTIRPDSSVQVPPAAPAVAPGEVYHFGHIDGMYSYCHDSAGKLVHVPAWADVDQVGKPKDWP